MSDEQRLDVVRRKHGAADAFGEQEEACTQTPLDVLMAREAPSDDPDSYHYMGRGLRVALELLAPHFRDPERLRREFGYLCAAVAPHLIEVTGFQDLAREYGVTREATRKQMEKKRQLMAKGGRSQFKLPNQKGDESREKMRQSAQGNASHRMGQAKKRVQAKAKPARGS